MRGLLLKFEPEKVYRKHHRDDLEIDFSALHRILGQETGRIVEPKLNAFYICGSQALRRWGVLRNEGIFSSAEKVQ